MLHEDRSTATAHESSEFDKALLVLKVNDEAALFILLAEDGTVNRMGDGTPENTDRQMYVGLDREPLFARLMSRISPELLQHQGEYEMPHRQGAICELTVMFGFRGSARSAGFRFLYGAESEGPPSEMGELVRYSVELTTPWHEEQKRLAAESR